MGRRKLTEQEKLDRKNAKQENAIETYSEIDKESQLTVFTTPKKELLSPEVIEKYKKEMLLVGELSGLSGHNIFGFSGNKTYEDALKQACEFRNSYNTRKDGTDKIKLINFFAQEHSGKSILVSYDLIKNK